MISYIPHCGRPQLKTKMVYFVTGYKRKFKYVHSWKYWKIEVRSSVYVLNCWKMKVKHMFTMFEFLKYDIRKSF